MSYPKAYKAHQEILFHEALSIRMWYSNDIGLYIYIYLVYCFCFFLVLRFRDEDQVPETAGVCPVNGAAVPRRGEVAPTGRVLSSRSVSNEKKGPQRATHKKGFLL